MNQMNTYESNVRIPVPASRGVLDPTFVKKVVPALVIFTCLPFSPEFEQSRQLQVGVADAGCHRGKTAHAWMKS